MRCIHKSWLLEAALIVQWAVLLYFVGDLLLIIYVQLHFGGVYPSSSCLRTTLSDTIPCLLVMAFGFVATFSLRRVSWARWMYFLWTAFVLVFAVGLFFPFVPPFLISDLYVPVFAVLCVATSIYFARKRPPKTT